MNIRQKIAEAARQPLLRSSLGSLVVQVASIGIVVLSNILLTRWLGDSEFARYAYILSWTQLLTVVAMLGLQDVLLKELGTLLGAQEYGLAVSLVRQALRESVLSGCVVAIAIIAAAFAADSTDELWRNRYVLVAAAPTIVGFVYIFQVQGVVRCYCGVVLGLLSEKIVRPLLIH